MSEPEHAVIIMQGEEVRCIVCARAAVAGDFFLVSTDGHRCGACIGLPAAPVLSPLDIAIAGSTALDPAGNRRTAEQLKVPSFEEREAERKLVAERIASMGRTT